MNNIVIVEQLIPHYREQFFQDLQNSVSDMNDIYVLHSSHNKSAFIVNNIHSFNNIYVHNYKFCWFNFQNIICPLLRLRPQIIITDHNPYNLTNYLLILLRKIFRFKLMFWGHGGSNKFSLEDNLKIKNYFHRLFIKSSDKYLAYTEGVAKRILPFTSNGRIVNVKNTINVEAMILVRKSLQSVDVIKQQLGLSYPYYITYIGRLYKEKRADIVLEVYQQLKSRYDIGVIIIGDGEEAERLKAISDNRVLFTGNIGDWNISGKYLYCSNIVFIPGDIGLAINHSFAFGTPVLTQEHVLGKSPNHGPEYSYLIDKYNGRICQNGSLESMTECAIDLIENTVGYKKNVEQYIDSNLHLEDMVDAFRLAVS
ncbi:MAG TPA: hypothetical protein DCS13_05530 [Candidatus Margulisbacteria bacterium]|nr:MAG: hypothetical protein A2X43_10445 [Candidatus Margulisbacteria bacterium GWD2_39_127]HAR62909.1 hypothetical protein [Candidatus Margulisiibacteriota bacterium]